MLETSQPVEEEVGDREDNKVDASLYIDSPQYDART